MVERLPARYEAMRCRSCHRLIEPDLPLLASFGRRPTAERWQDCIYRCECGLAYSNAQREDERTLIFRSPERNVPKEVRSGLAEALKQAANHRNRRAKWNRFCFQSSEDAVTWTVLRGLERQGRLDALVAPRQVAGEPALLLWGAPVAGERAGDVAEELARVCRSLGESPGSLSEPDAVVAWRDLLVIVEAKFRSPNDHRPSYRGFARYLDRSDLFAAAPEAVAAAGYYELTRNWRIGTALAQALGIAGFLLVNLGPPEKIETDAQAFESLLDRSAGRDFAYMSWSDLLEAAAPIEPWLDRYASERHRLLYWR
ncbi:MAG: hypothetical protein ACXVZP_08950 [Gaiellaceae bacterium]